MKILPVSIALALVVPCATAIAADQPDAEAVLKQAQQFFKPLPEDAFSKEEKASNQLKDRIELGQYLYFDPRLSLTGNISCNSCHNLATYGVDNGVKSLGVGAQLGGRNAPTVLNAALLISQFWDGRAADVEEQAGGPMLNPVEMGLPDEQTAVQRIKDIPGYLPMFEKAFGKNDPITFQNITHSIAAYERTLITPSPFDKFLKGDVNALNAQQIKGLQTFINNGCSSCHQGVALGGGMYQKFGLVKGPYWELTGSKDHDAGRSDFTGKEEDKFFFRVPSLRNVTRTYPYFHDGSVNSLPHAVRIMGMAQLGKELSDEEVSDIIAFLDSTTGNISESARTLPILPGSDPDKLEASVNEAQKKVDEKSDEKSDNPKMQVNVKNVEKALKKEKFSK